MEISRIAGFKASLINSHLNGLLCYPIAFMPFVIYIVRGVTYYEYGLNCKIKFIIEDLDFGADCTSSFFESDD